ncbi:nucleotide-binding universal stress UspA family protein [Paraburkholderia atlantica]|uniref:Nucleotide-binding universal stress UspA family protein n=1 Tax=Paraburkholderia atlantica TaxID=2654982 RepID=A0A6I1PM54_PARAM|nr:universal stress protein [Paraburkholderia atlantica]MBB5414616.1 nucleotide-binding universal stress UspA family protein [Paraburkholderia atlantica]MBB5423429.1 nucleotide-binding universal stress UspA family protein [Paraburkholderia atlantica]MPW05306.1 universal stress protein [Paraburkholderia atlantica]NUY29125.1 universal stress protein [Paraburkholderia atlantica]
MYARILVALDDSPSAQRAFAEALKLAKLTGATLEACCVVGHGKWSDNADVAFEPEPAGAAQAFASRALDGPRELLREAQVPGGVRVIDAYAENVSAVLARVADEIEADLIVMGTHGRHGVQRFLLGSVAESLVRSTDIPVLIVRHDEQGHPRP